MEVRLVVYDNGERKTFPVQIELLPPNLREKYAPFAGKTVTWKNDTIVEMETV
jgi:hypothetical protein